MTWNTVRDGVWRYRDSCNVYAVRGPEGMLVIDAGTGYWLDHVGELPGPVRALALTHFFRDHAAGAARAAKAGIAVHAGEYERDILADPQQHFGARETYIIYDNHWDLFAPIEATPIAGVLRDYDRVTLAGLDIEVIPLPGVTQTQIGLKITLNGQTVIFCGEAIHSPGKLARVAPLQYNYNDCPGALNVAFSTRVLRKHRPDVLLPSLGEPIVQDTDKALAALEQSMRELTETRFGMRWALDQLDSPPLTKVTDHVWVGNHSSAKAWFLISESGKAMTIDYGYNAGHTLSQGYPRRYTRRPVLHSIDGLKEQFGIERIDVALISHFHDDHVCGVPLLQRVHGTECWAAANFAELLERPEAHCFPCTWPVPLRVDRRLRLDQTFQWEEYTFHLAPMNGHTRFAALIGFEADGKRYAHTGDQYFFQQGAAQFKDNALMHNYVYRNGALLDGYAQSGRWLLDWRPDIVIQGHQDPMHTDEHFFQHIESFTTYYETIHRNAMVLDDETAHLNLDSWGGWIWPYRTHLKQAGPAKVTVTVRNPLPKATALQVKLVGPDGWRGEAATLEAGPRAEVSREMTITPTGPCRRQPFAVEMTIDGQPWGQVAEALITVGGAMF